MINVWKIIIIQDFCSIDGKMCPLPSFLELLPMFLPSTFKLLILAALKSYSLPTSKRCSPCQPMSSLDHGWKWADSSLHHPFFFPPPISYLQHWGGETGKSHLLSFPSYHTRYRAYWRTAVSGSYQAGSSYLSDVMRWKEDRNLTTAVL